MGTDCIRRIHVRVCSSNDAGIQQRSTGIPVKYKSKPNWIAAEEEAAMEETARRIERRISGKHRLDLQWIIEKQRRRYARFGKNNKRIP